MRLSRAELEERLKSGKESIIVNRGSKGRINVDATLSPAIDLTMKSSHNRSRQAIDKPEKYIEVWNINERRWTLLHLRQIEMVGKLRTNGISA